MPHFASWVAFALVALGMVLTPGPNTGTDIHPVERSPPQQRQPVTVMVPESALVSIVVFTLDIAKLILTDNTPPALRRDRNVHGVGPATVSRDVGRGAAPTVVRMFSMKVLCEWLMPRRRRLGDQGTRTHGARLLVMRDP